MKRWRWLCLGVALACFGCNPNWVTTDNPLDLASIELTIDGFAATGLASVEAEIRDELGFVIELENGQSVTVDDEELVGPSGSGDYSATVAVQNTYTVVVTEPSRGVETTNLVGPTSFTITAPTTAASLSGFTLTWSQANADLTVEVVIQQSLFGSVRRAEFGPVTDTGALALTDDDLSEFQQGAPLTVTVRKSAEYSNINGFNDAEVTITLTVQTQLTPET